MHQKFIKISSKLHEKFINTSRIQFLWGRFAEHILNLQLWFTEKIGWPKFRKILSKVFQKYPRYFFWLYSIDFPWVCTRYVLLGAAFNWLYKRLHQLPLYLGIWLNMSILVYEKVYMTWTWMTLLEELSWIINKNRHI